MSTLLLFDFHSDRKYGKYSRKGKMWEYSMREEKKRREIVGCSFIWLSFKLLQRIEGFDITTLIEFL